MRLSLAATIDKWARHHCPPLRSPPHVIETEPDAQSSGTYWQ
jgi:hypothetical protein